MFGENRAGHQPVDFAAEFIRSNGAPIKYKGRVLRDSYELPVSVGDRLLVVFERFTQQPVQGLGIGSPGKGFQMEIVGHRAKDFVLWTDTAPQEVTVLVTKAPPGARARFWNVWRDLKHGNVMYGVNAAALEVQPQVDGSVLLLCSDGWQGPDFEDLIVRVRKQTAE